MHNYVYELLQGPVPADKRATEYDLSECPDAFPVADRIGTVEDRQAVIARFGAWLEEHRLGLLYGEGFPSMPRPPTVILRGGLRHSRMLSLLCKS